MRYLTLALLAAGSALIGVAVAPQPAAARDYPYCLVGPSAPWPGDCTYYTYDQCRLSASGRLADCNINPRVAFRNPGAHDWSDQPPPPVSKKRYRSQY